MSTERILLVEDDPDVRMFIRFNLEGAGFTAEIREAEDGDEGLEQAMWTRPDLVISDIRHPGLDGLELMRPLRADPRTAGAHLILLTARVDPAEATAAGVDASILKPFDPRRLLGHVPAVLPVARGGPNGSPRGAIRFDLHSDPTER